MIGDLCKPLNPGESDTVRIVMQVGEAELLLRALRKLAVGHDETILTELQGILRRAVGWKSA